MKKINKVIIFFLFAILGIVMSQGKGCYVGAVEKLKDVSIKDLSKENIGDYNPSKQNNFVLLAKLPKNHLYIYGMNNDEKTGVIIRKGNKIKKIDMEYMGADCTFPEIRYIDYDKDEVKELLFVCSNSQGSEIFSQDLWILEPDTKNVFNDYAVKADDIINSIKKSVSYKINNKKLSKQTLQFFNARTKSKLCNVIKMNFDSPITSVLYGSMLQYYVDKNGKINVYLSCSLMYKGNNVPADLDDVVEGKYIKDKLSAQVGLYHNKMKLKNIRLKGGALKHCTFMG